MDPDALTVIPGVPFPEYYELFMDWKTPLTIAAVYAVSVHLLNPSATKAKVSRVEAKNQGAGTASKSSGFMTAFVFAHNLSLAIYSMVTFYNMVQYMHKLFNRGQSIHDSVSGRKLKFNNDWGIGNLIFFFLYETIGWVIHSTAIRMDSCGIMHWDTGATCFTSPSFMK
jgi:hypothetical protein